MAPERPAAWQIFAIVAVIGGAAAWWNWAHGYTLYYGDAEAHLNIARRIVDSQAPGWAQVGTVWLPLPHLLWAALVWSDGLWKNGLAGVIPTVLFFALAGAFLYAAAFRAYACGHAAACAAMLFALNPNMLFLESAPMTEAIFAAALAALLWAALWFRDSQSLGAVAAAGAASNMASLTRYEGWFLIPFFALYLLLVAKRKRHAMLFVGLAALGPLAWLGHNQYYFSNPLEFYNGPYSAMAIYQRQLAAGGAPYPGHQNWAVAARYYFAAMNHVLGIPLLCAGVAGAAVARKAWWPLALLALPGPFYVWSIHSGSTPLFVPDLEPFGLYNTRYALVMLPALALAAGGLVTLLPGRWHTGGMAVVILGITATWAAQGGVSICWKEAAANSADRRAWTAEAAEYLTANYRSGAGILFSFGDLTGVLRQAGIPLREALYLDSAAGELREEWILAQPGDAVSGAVSRAGAKYHLEKQVMSKGVAAVEIYRREYSENTVH